jgi:hypothetical protein
MRRRFSSRRVVQESNAGSRVCTVIELLLSKTAQLFAFLLWKSNQHAKTEAIGAVAGFL